LWAVLALAVDRHVIGSIAYGVAVAAILFWFPMFAPAYMGRIRLFRLLSAAA
jgi:hypothetical protein